MGKVLAEGDTPGVESYVSPSGKFEVNFVGESFVNLALVGGITLDQYDVGRYNDKGHWKTLQNSEVEELITVLTYYLEHHVRHNV